MEFKGTKGEWQPMSQNTHGEWIQTDGIIPDLIARVNGASIEERFANAKLIADAGNTAIECGLLPSELLKHRNELLEACKIGLEAIRELHSFQDGWGEEDDIISKAINKALK